MIEIVKTDTYRSQDFAGVNHEPDMTSVTLDMPRATWRLLQNFIKDSGFFEMEDTATEGGG